MIFEFICTNPALIPGISTNASTGLQTFKCFDADGEIVLGIVQMKPVTVTAAPVLDPLTGFTDGAVLGWGVVAAMAMAYGIHLLRRAL